MVDASGGWAGVSPSYLSQYGNYQQETILDIRLAAAAGIGKSTASPVIPRAALVPASPMRATFGIETKNRPWHTQGFIRFTKTFEIFCLPRTDR